MCTKWICAKCNVILHYGIIMLYFITMLHHSNNSACCDFSRRWILFCKVLIITYVHISLYEGNTDLSFFFRHRSQSGNWKHYPQCRKYNKFGHFCKISVNSVSMLVNEKMVFQPHFHWNTHKYQSYEIHLFFGQCSSVVQLFGFNFTDILKVNITSNHRKTKQIWRFYHLVGCQQKCWY